MIDNIKRRPGEIVQHQDGRKGIAYNDDQLQQFLDQEKMIVRFFLNENFKLLAKEKRAVKFEKLTRIGFID